MKLSIKKLVITGTILATIVGGIWLMRPTEATGCSDFNVVACGTYSHASVKVAYRRAEIKSIYNQVGITDDMVKNGTNMREGTVDANGKITVGGQVVATNAVTLQAKAGTRQVAPQRQYSAAGHTYYQYTTGQSFILGRTSFPIFAWFDKYGKFIAGVIKDCGNPVWGTPTWQPKDIKVCDLTTKKIITIKENAYDSKKHSKDENDCKMIKVCDLTSKKIVTIREKDFNSKKYSKDENDCKEIRVCDLKTNTIITIKEKEFDSKKHSKDESDCENVEVCKISTKEIVQIARKDLTDDHTTDFSKCEETPEIPEVPETPDAPETPAPEAPEVAELPKTGVGDVIVSALGLGGLTAAASAYVASRKRV